MAGPAGVTVLSGARLVLPDRVASDLSLVIDNGRILELRRGLQPVGQDDRHVDLSGCVVTPGFVDVHIHGSAGIDVLDSAEAVAEIARMLPRWGVTAFCPTATAAAPDLLERFLSAVAAARRDPPAAGARVLPAHLETSFINPDYRGAQPLAHLRPPAHAFDPAPPESTPGEFSARDVLTVIERHRADVGIATIAPELPGGLELVRSLAAAGIRVSLGHSGATFDEAQQAITAGAVHATHLYNRMRPMSHREPGLVGAVLATEAVAAELICDGVHLHPAVVRTTIAAKGSARVMAITDATAGAGLPRGARTTLGGQPIVVSDVARLEDGTMAGSVATMDRVFGWLVTACGLDLVQAAEVCSTTPARHMGLVGLGVLAPGAVADLVVLDAHLRLQETWIGGRRCFPAPDPLGTPGPVYPSSRA